MVASRFRTLLPSGLAAEIRPDAAGFGAGFGADLGADLGAGPEAGHREAAGLAGFTLYIGGEAQSHVFSADQTHLLFDYVRRVANLTDALAPAGQPITALHLGAGALTVPRYIALTRPGSRQLVIESEENLVDFVTAYLPLPAPSTALPNDITVQIDDARRGLTAASRFGSFDLIVVDVYAGSSTPAHLTTRQFYAEVALLLSPDGIVVVNVADDDGLALVRAQTASLAAVLPTTVVLGPTDLVMGKGEGNAVLAASRSAYILSLLGRVNAAGPHPNAVVLPGDLRDFIGDAQTIRDARG